MDPLLKTGRHSFYPLADLDLLCEFVVPFLMPTSI